MDFKQQSLYHQIHPAKLITDWSTAFVAAWLFWGGHLVLGLAVGIVPAPIASALVIRLADLERLKGSAFGRYIARYMTATAQVLRLLGAAAFWVAAWYHSWLGMVAGLLVIVAAWSYGLLLRN